jgi:hypothetical protein
LSVEEQFYLVYPFVLILGRRCLLGVSYRNRPTFFLDSGYDGSGLAYNKVSFQNSLQRLVDCFPDRRFILVEDIPVGAELSISNAARAMHIQNV